MSYWYENELEANQRQRERLQEAEHDRLIRAARGRRRNSSRLSGRAMLWLGHRLVESGKRIQED